MIDHDRLFKELISTFFLEFIELFLPDVTAYVDRDSVAFLDKEVFTEVTTGDRHEADLVASARFKDEEVFFLFLIEHQGRPEGEFGRRLFRYFARLYEKFGLPVYPIVIFSYDKPGRAEPTMHRVEFPNKVVLEFSYEVIQLNRLYWRDYLRHENPVASALMSKMRMSAEERPRVKLECLRLLATLRLNRAKMQLISGFVDTYLQLSRAEEKIFARETEVINKEERQEVMEIVTSWMHQGLRKGWQKGLQEGRQKGRQEGRQEGLQQGEVTVILRVLRRRLGSVSKRSQKRIEKLSLAGLEALADALLDLNSAKELSRWLDGHAGK